MPRSEQPVRSTRAPKRAAWPWPTLVLATSAVLLVLVLARPSLGGQAPAPGALGAVAAPDFDLTLYQGADSLGGAEELRFADVFALGRPVVLNFWAGLCPPCRAEMPAFQRVYQALDGRFVLLGLDIGPFVQLGTRADGQALLRELGIVYPVGTTFDSGVLAAYRVRGMPTTVFLTAQGEVFATHAGLLDEKTFRTRVEELLAASEGAG